MAEPSIFTKIINGDVPSKKLYEDDHCIVIDDLYPQAPVHMLVIPKKPLVSLADAEKEDQALLGHLMLVAANMAQKAGIDSGFRLVANNGKDAGQTVFHLHFHVLGGLKQSEQGL